MLLTRRPLPWLALLAAPLLSVGCSVRLDDGRARNQAVQMERRDDPQGQPSARERRQARAMAEAQAELMASGADIRYRSDGSSSRPESVRFVERPGALTVDYDAYESQNSLHGVPHALTFVVYHLRDRAGLDQVARTEEGVRRLLEGDRFDESVLAVRRLSVQPGVRGQLVVDRPENGRYVALVAGYHRPRPETSLHVAEYPLGSYSHDGESLLHRKSRMFLPLPLRLAATFGETEMRVRDTGLVYGDMRRVTLLTHEQMRHYTMEQVRERF